MSTARFGLRASQALRQNFRMAAQRRYQSTVAEGAAKEETAFSKFFNSPVGPKTVHFWAPIMKVHPQTYSPAPHTSVPTTPQYTH